MFVMMIIIIIIIIIKKYIYVAVSRSDECYRF